MLDRPFLELGRVLLLRDLLHLIPPKSNVNCTSPLEDYLSGEPHYDDLTDVALQNRTDHELSTELQTNVALFHCVA